MLGHVSQVSVMPEGLEQMPDADFRKTPSDSVSALPAPTPQ